VSTAVVSVPSLDNLLGKSCSLCSPFLFSNFMVILSQLSSALVEREDTQGSPLYTQPDDRALGKVTHVVTTAAQCINAMTMAWCWREVCTTMHGFLGDGKFSTTLICKRSRLC
jgi:hypothetical protein